jgi:hypothetical protein
VHQHRAHVRVCRHEQANDVRDLHRAAHARAQTTTRTHKLSGRAHLLIVMGR